MILCYNEEGVHDESVFTGRSVAAVRPQGHTASQPIYPNQINVGLS
jgi:hypothetical protein